MRHRDWSGCGPVKRFLVPPHSTARGLHYPSADRHVPRLAGNEHQFLLGATLYL
jgi:hypothetical protein